jgi:hypothetical protein
MGNHFHMATTYKNGSASLSNFMRYTHGLFGAQYNKTSNRSGSVAEGRPKTPLIQELSGTESVPRFSKSEFPLRFRTLAK